ncbi:hypothetical protein [Pedobacter aquatilis]
MDKISGQPFAENFQLNQFNPARMRGTIFGDSRDVIAHFSTDD